MDDSGGRLLEDVINDPHLLESFLVPGEQQQPPHDSDSDEVIDTIDCLLKEVDAISTATEEITRRDEQINHPSQSETESISSEFITTAASVNEPQPPNHEVQEAQQQADNNNIVLQETDILSSNRNSIETTTTTTTTTTSAALTSSSTFPATITTTTTTSLVTTSSTSAENNACKGKAKTSKKPSVKKPVAGTKSNSHNKKKGGKQQQVSTVTSSDHSSEDSFSSGQTSFPVGGQPLPSPGISSPQIRAPGVNMIAQQFVQMPGGTGSLQLQGIPGSFPGQVVLTRPSMGSSQAPMMQIIQTPNGPQLLQMPLQSPIAIQSKAAPSTPVARVGNKQILPKPSSASTGTSSTTTTAMSSTAPSGNSSVNASQFLRPNLAPNLVPSSSGSTSQPQLIIGQNSQGHSLIQGPNGTLLLNPAALQGHLQGQPFLIQGNMAGVGSGPVQLTLRTQPQVIVSSSPSSSINNSSLLNALTSSMASSQSTVSVTTSNSPRTAVLQTPNGPQTFVLQPPPASSASNIPTSMPLMIPSSTGQSSFAFTSSNGQIIQSGIPGQQVLFSQPTPDLSQTSQQQPEEVPKKGKKNTKKEKPPPAPKKSKAKGKSKGVNLADLLKESGILESSPPTSPTKTCDQTETGNGSLVVNPTGILPQGQVLPGSVQPTMFMMNPSTGGNIVLTPGLQQHQMGPQLRLSLTPDGSVVIQQNVQQAFMPTVPGMIDASSVNNNNVSQSKLLDSVKDSSQPSPDSTTPTLDAVAPVVSSQSTSSSSSVKSALVEHLNNKANTCSPKTTSVKKETKKTTKKSPKKESSIESVKIKTEPISVPASIASNILGTPSSVSVSASTTSSTPNVSSPTAVIRIGNCDNLIQASTLPVLLTNDSSPKKENESEGKVPVVQISLDDHEFAGRLETHIKNLMAVETPTQEQNNLLKELQTLQKTMSDARSKNTVCTSTVTPSTSSAPEGMKVLIAVPPRIQEPLQSSQIQPQFIQTHVLQTNTQTVQPQQTQLVNILNTNQANQTIRLISTPVTTNTIASEATPSMFQVGNQQFITITSSAKHPTMDSNLQMPPANTPLIQVVRLQAPSGQRTTGAPSVKTPVDPVVEAEKRKAKVLKFFKQQLDSDQRFALKPDYKTPFRNKDDACKRLLRYHIFYSDHKINMEKVDKDFEQVSTELLIRKQGLFDRFQRSLLRQNCLKHDSHEKIMLNKLFVEDETNALKFDKEVVAQGIPLDLPPPPRSWQSEISASIDAEVQREQFSFKRKLPFNDEDLTDHFTDIKRPSLTPSSSILSSGLTESVMNLEGNLMSDQNSMPIGQEQNESEDEDEDSDDDEDDTDDDDDDDDDDNPADDMSAYLGPNNNDEDENVDNLENIYDEINYSTRTELGDLNPFSSHHHHHHQHLDHLTHAWGGHSAEYSSTSWPAPRTGFTDVEAAVAVDSILTSEDDDEETKRFSEELTRIEAQLQREDQGEDDEDEEEELPRNGAYPCYPDADSSSMTDVQHLQQQQQLHSVSSCDPQMQCAIDSILADIPTASSAKPSPYYPSGDVYGRGPTGVTSGGYGLNPGMNTSHRGINMPSFGHSIHHPGQMNDPALDEAVKSILS